MESKPAQNIQDSFLNTARKDKAVITIYLLSGVKLSGRIRSFDKYSVVLETNNQEQLIFKHAISTVVMARGTHISDRGEFRPAPAAGTPAPSTNNTRSRRIRFTLNGGISYSQPFGAKQLLAAAGRARGPAFDPAFRTRARFPCRHRAPCAPR